MLCRFRLLLVFFFFRLFWLTEAISIVIIVIEFLFVLGVLPVGLLALNTELQVGVDILLRDLMLTLLDKKRKLVVELMDEIQYVQKLRRIGLS